MSQDESTEATVVQSGYDAVFSPELDHRYMCPVCLEALRDPVQTTICGHRFCKTCLQQSRRNSMYTRCPLDKILFHAKTQVFEDNAARREVLSLTIKCDNFPDGCLWKGELRERESHITNCPEMKVACQNNCGHVCKSRSMSEHSECCPQRTVSCQKCDRSLLASELAKHHLLVCAKFPVACPLCQEVEILRENMPRHVSAVEGDCPMVVVRCEFESIGCYFQNIRKNMAAHSSDANLHHMKLLMNKVHQNVEGTRHLDALLRQTQQFVVVTRQKQTKIESQVCEMSTQAASIKDLQNQQEKFTAAYDLAWCINLPEDRLTEVSSPVFCTRAGGKKRIAKLQFTKSAAPNRSPAASFSIFKTQSNDSADLSADCCHVTLISQSPRLTGYCNDFTFTVSCSEAGSEPGLASFMSADELYGREYCKDGRIRAVFRFMNSNV